MRSRLKSSPQEEDEAHFFFLSAHIWSKTTKTLTLYIHLFIPTCVCISLNFLPKLTFHKAAFLQKRGVCFKLLCSSFAQVLQSLCLKPIHAQTLQSCSGREGKGNPPAEMELRLTVESSETRWSSRGAS